MMSEVKLLEVLRKIAKDHGYDNNGRTLDVKPFTGGGVNFFSRLFSVILSSPGKDELKLFVKIAAIGEQIRSTTPIQLYEIEIMFYTKILPKFRDLENRYKIPEKDRLVLPKYYGGVMDYGEELMAFEDLSAKGFQTLNECSNIDWNCASACVEALAKHHALSVAFEKNDPRGYREIIDKLKLFTLREHTFDYTNRFIESAIKVIDEIYRSRVEVFLRKAVRHQASFKFFNLERKVVLTHGDFRTSNILHKLDEDGKLQVILLDYQFIKQGNPATDLVFFLVTGTDEAFRAKHFHQFFDHYYETFSQALQRLGIDPETVYTEKEFRDDVKEMLPLGLSFAAFSLMFITADESCLAMVEGDFDLDKVEITPTEQYRQCINGLVRNYVTWGIL